MKEIFHYPYVYWLIAIFLLYFGFNVYISEFYIIIQYLPIYLSTVNWSKLIFEFTLSLVIAALVAVNMVYGYIRYTERQQIKNSGVLACAGAVGGLATGVCSSCVVSVFPLIMGFFGVTFSWAFLPFGGIEVQILTLLLLGVSLWLMKK